MYDVLFSTKGQGETQRMITNKKRRKQPLPYDVIVQASEGNSEDLDSVLKHLILWQQTVSTMSIVTHIYTLTSIAANGLI